MADYTISQTMTLVAEDLTDLARYNLEDYTVQSKERLRYAMRDLDRIMDILDDADLVDEDNDEVEAHIEDDLCLACRDAINEDCCSDCGVPNHSREVHIGPSRHPRNGILRMPKTRKMTKKDRQEYQTLSQHARGCLGDLRTLFCPCCNEEINNAIDDVIEPNQVDHDGIIVRQIRTLVRGVHEDDNDIVMVAAWLGTLDLIKRIEDVDSCEIKEFLGDGTQWAPVSLPSNPDIISTAGGE